MDLFPDYPDSASCWIYAADRTLTATQQDDVLQHLQPFLSEWTSHKLMVSGAAEVLHDRFLVLVAVMAEGALSGCGIDKSVHRIEAAAAGAGFGWASSLDILYRAEDGEVRQVGRSGFRSLVSEGIVHEASPVFDLGVTHVGGLRDGLFETEVGRAWHGRVFGVPSLRSA